MMMKKKKIRIERIILVAVIGIAVLFGGFKLIQFTAEKVAAIFTEEKDPKPEVPEVTDTRPVVLIDPGHGGVDGGAKKGNLLEKDITLKMAKATGAYLEKQDIKVVYTRTEDIRLNEDRFTDLALRAAMSAKNNAKLFVSIHVNAFENSSTPEGFEVHYKNNKAADIKADELDVSKLDFDSINKTSQSLAKTLSSEITSLKYTKDRGLQNGKELRILRLNTVPSVLIETGFINNTNDYKFLSDDAKVKSYGEAIAKGIVKQLQTKAAE